MNKFIIAFVAVLTLTSTAAFAGNGKKAKANPAEVTLQRNFPGATDVKWFDGKESIGASFVLSDSRVVAFFNHDGELLGTARSVLFNQLPLAVIREINNRYGSAPIADIIEYTRDSEAFYDMLVQTPTKDLKLRISSVGDISVLEKIRK